MPLVITDASVLIGLARAGHLRLLPDLFGEVVAPTAVADEFGERLAWLRVVSVEEPEALGELRALKLDPGETEAIALALAHPDATLLIDERRGRRYAAFRGLRIVGTFGLVVLAKRSGLVPAVRPVFDALMDEGRLPRVGARLRAGARSRRAKLELLSFPLSNGHASQALARSHYPREDSFTAHGTFRVSKCAADVADDKTGAG